MSNAVTKLLDNAEKATDATLARAVSEARTTGMPVLVYPATIQDEGTHVALNAWIARPDGSDSVSSTPIGK